MLPGASRCFPVVPPCFPVARRRRMFLSPANAPHAAMAYRTTALNARQQDRGGGPGPFFFWNVNKVLDCGAKRRRVESEKARERHGPGDCRRATACSAGRDQLSDHHFSRAGIHCWFLDCTSAYIKHATNKQTNMHFPRMSPGVHSFWGGEI